MILFPTKPQRFFLVKRHSAVLAIKLVTNIFILLILVYLVLIPIYQDQVMISRDIHYALVDTNPDEEI